MDRAVGMDASEQKVIDDIAEFGWHCVHVQANGLQPPFSYTVGLFHTYKRPELFISGLPAQVTQPVLERAVRSLPTEKPINMSGSNGVLFEGISCVFVKVPNAESYLQFGICRWYYQGQPFPVYQIVWPDRGGRFPWHPQASRSFGELQPVLGHVRPGA